MSYKFPSTLILLVITSVFWRCSTPAPSDAETAAETATDSISTDDKSDRLSPLRVAEGEIGGVHISITYSSPAVKDRTIWGDLEPYGQVWRTGANEATVISFEQPLLIEGQPVAAGKYALFTIPRKDAPWTVILNKVWDQWGAYNYDEAEDVLRVESMPIELEETVENLRFGIDGTAGKIVFSWEKVMLGINVAAQGQAS